MSRRDFSPDVVLGNLKDVLNTNSVNGMCEVSLDSDLVALDNISESDLLGSAKTDYEKDLHNKVLENEKLIKNRLDRLKTYSDDIF